MEKGRRKKGLAILLAVAMVLGLVPNAGMVNVSAEEEAHEHLYDNGVCTTCGVYQVPECADNYYQIANMGNLYWFAGLVNNDAGICTGDVTQNTSANAVLTADITVNRGLAEGNTMLESLVYDESGNVTNGGSFTSWTPIGTSYSVTYTGTFDGKGYTISGLYFNNS
ncbi:MAG: hypothetical protein ACI4GD_02360, partial [Lachnospiraceae bacterium]